MKLGRALLDGLLCWVAQEALELDFKAQFWEKDGPYLHSDTSRYWSEDSPRKPRQKRNYSIEDVQIWTEIQRIKFMVCFVSTGSYRLALLPVFLFECRERKMQIYGCA